MSSKGRIFRVFRCPHCGYTGYRQVSHQNDDSLCNLCSNPISHSPEMRYVTTVDEARTEMQKIVVSGQKSKSRYGLGVKRRILNMVYDLSEFNKGNGVSRRRILEECKEADIDLDKAKRFLIQLEEEGLIIEIDDLLRVTQEDLAW
ncbi:hypothetical protein EU527_02475 [Candidatus Thorarchaeota archaeon]|nr:MAG: hypothetical protein EU527_02475 [Candidatus Thorarchaeota archaeon]